FDGGVVSHTILSKDGKRQTIGAIRPGQYHFKTEEGERMDIISGECFVKLATESLEKKYSTGETFFVAPRSSFDITVKEGLTEYLCSFES
ncbi:MAG: pyrimidine/purine nucleoside phosphorylase, partial [Elusimicrobiota bacterium]